MKAPGDLLPRVGVAVVGIPVVLGAFHLGGWTLGALLAAVAVLGVFEFYELARLRGDRAIVPLGGAASAVLVLGASAHPVFGDFALVAVWVLLGLVAATLLLSLFVRWPGGSPLGALGATLGGVAYVALPLTFVVFLREWGEWAFPAADAGFFGPMAYVLFPLFVVWASDTAAYFVGVAIGRIRLAPSISPKKSVEGAVAGVLGGAGAGALVSTWWLGSSAILPVGVATAAWMGAAVSVGGQIGDLVESVLKREAGVKDSGRLLPGHGGFLDRLDALLWAFPLAWVLLGSWMSRG